MEHRNDPRFFNNDTTSPEYIELMRNIINSLNVEFAEKYGFELKINDKGEPVMKLIYSEPITLVKYEDIKEEDNAIALSVFTYDYFCTLSEIYKWNIFPVVSDDDKFDLPIGKLCFIVNEELYKYIQDNCFTFTKSINEEDEIFIASEMIKDLILINDFIHFNK
jgi:hypothetical protein